MINPVHLQTLKAVLDTGSLSGAAKVLGYTTSAVSQQIAALERSVGVRLFERGPRSLWPTSAALQMGGQANEILYRIGEVEETMRAFSEGRRWRLRVGAFATVGARLLPDALARLVDRFHDTELLVHDGDPRELAESVREAKTDLALVCEYDLVPRTWPGELRVHPVLDEETVLIRAAGHGDSRVRLGELAEEVWISNHPGSAGHDNLLRACAQAGFSPDVRFCSDDFDVVRGIVRAGLGVALVPSLALGGDQAIAVRRLPGGGPRRRVHALYRSTDPNPLLPVAVDAIRRTAREFASGRDGVFGAPCASPLAQAHGDLPAG